MRNVYNEGYLKMSRTNTINSSSILINSNKNDLFAHLIQESLIKFLLDVVCYLRKYDLFIFYEKRVLIQEAI